MVNTQSLRESLAGVDKHRLAENFLRIVRSDYPELGRLFPIGDEKRQTKEMIQAVDFLLANIEDPSRVRSFLKTFSNQHETLDRRHCYLIGSCFLKILKTQVGRRWSSQLNYEWTQLLHLLFNDPSVRVSDREESQVA